MMFSPESYMESLENAEGWKAFIEECEPILKVMVDAGCTFGEALTVLWLNRVLAAVWALDDDHPGGESGEEISER